MAKNKNDDMFASGTEEEVVSFQVDNSKAEKQAKIRKTFIKVAVGLAIIATLGMVAFALVGCNNNQLGSTNGNNPGISQGGGNNGGGAVNPGINQGGNGKEDPSINPGGNGGQDDPVDPPVVTPPVNELTEADYKVNFENELLAEIRACYNENIAPVEDVFLDDLKLELVNYETGDIYFTCTQNNERVMFIANNEEIAKLETYKALYENLPETFSFTKAISVQEDALAEQIVEFALSQPAIQTFADENNLDLSSYTVINATEFANSPDGRKSDIVLLTEEGVLTFSLVGVTGTCSSQEEYLNVMKSSPKVQIKDAGFSNYYEIPVEEAESSASAEIPVEEAESSASAEITIEEAESSASAEIINEMQNQFPDYDISMGL